MRFTYGMRVRGFSIGCQPKGVIVRADDPTDRFYDLITYNRQLTAEETEHYSLTPLIDYWDVVGCEDKDTALTMMVLAGYDGWNGTEEEYNKLLNELKGDNK